jgi:hypothetical protein
MKKIEQQKYKNINKRITIIVYSLAAVLVASGIAYIMVANSEYSDYKDLASVGVKGGEVAEKQFEISFFIVAAAIYFGLCVWVLKSKEKRTKAPYVISIAVSVFLIVAYVASRTVGVPIVGVEYYIGRLDIFAKALQAIVIGLSFVAILNMKKQKSIAESRFRYEKSI